MIDTPLGVSTSTCTRVPSVRSIDVSVQVLSHGLITLEMSSLSSPIIPRSLSSRSTHEETCPISCVPWSGDDRTLGWRCCVCTVDYQSVREDISRVI